MRQEGIAKDGNAELEVVALIADEKEFCLIKIQLQLVFVHPVLGCDKRILKVLSRVEGVVPYITCEPVCHPCISDDVGIGADGQNLEQLESMFKVADHTL